MAENMNESSDDSDDDVKLSERINAPSNIKTNEMEQEMTKEEPVQKPKAKKKTLTERMCVMEENVSNIYDFIISDMIDNWKTDEGEITARKIKQRLTVLQLDSEDVELYIQKYTVTK